MATATQPAPENAAPEAEPLEPPRSLIHDLIVGVATQSWLASMAFHMALMVFLALIMGTIHVVKKISEAPEFEVVEDDTANIEAIEQFEVGYTPLDPTELTTETLTLEAPAVEAQFNDDSKIFEEAGGGIVGGDSTFGGLGGITVASTSLGPVLKGGGGVDAGAGFGKNLGTGGAGSGFGSRGSGMREAMLGSGGTKQSERAVAAALNWIARHQKRDGSWSLKHTTSCKGGFCSGPGENPSEGAATALALLPFLAAGQTHQSDGPYIKNIGAGLNALLKGQKPNGDLSATAGRRCTRTAWPRSPSAKPTA